MMGRIDRQTAMDAPSSCCRWQFDHTEPPNARDAAAFVLAIWQSAAQP